MHENNKGTPKTTNKNRIQYKSGKISKQNIDRDELYLYILHKQTTQKRYNKHPTQRYHQSQHEQNQNKQTEHQNKNKTNSHGYEQKSTHTTNTKT